jgi:hypothetical protein
MMLVGINTLGFTTEQTLSHLIHFSRNYSLTVMVISLMANSLEFNEIILVFSLTLRLKNEIIKKFKLNLQTYSMETFPSNVKLSIFGLIDRSYLRGTTLVGKTSRSGRRRK